MKKFKLKKQYIGLLVLFIFINTICLLYRDGGFALPFYVEVNVVVVANLILFIIALIGSYQHTKAVLNPNPNVFIRSVMLMTLIKFFVLGLAAVAYIILAKQDRNVPAIIIALFLYVIYAIFETRSAYKMNKLKHG